MAIGATVRVRMWEEMVRDGKLDGDGDILFQKSASYFDKEMRQYCGTTHKIIKSEILLNLDGCGDWNFTPEMLDYVEPEKAVDGLCIADLESQVADLTKKLVASERKCDRLARRLRAKWQAARDGEMATWVEIEKWIDAGKGSARRNGNELIICPNSNATWIPATRGNLKL